MDETYDLYDDSDGVFNLLAGKLNINEIYPDSEFPILAMMNMNESRLVRQRKYDGIAAKVQ